MTAPPVGRILFLFASASGCVWLWFDGRSDLFLNPRNAALLPWAGAFLWTLGLAELVSLRWGARRERIGIRHIAWVAPFALYPLVDSAGLSVEWARGRAAAVSASQPRSSGAEISEARLPLRLDTLEPVPAPDSLAVEEVADGTGGSRSPVRRGCRALLPVPAAPIRADGWCELPARPGARCVDTLSDGDWFERFRAIESSPQDHRGRWISATGFVIPADSGERWSFLLSRMLVWCCAADASPIGLRVVAPPGARPPGGGGWYRIEGTVASVHSSLEGRTVAILQAASVEPVPAPAQPNVFPFTY